MTNNFKSLPYRKGVGVMLLNNNNEVFTGERIDSTADAWQMPQGGIDPNEPPLDAAYRELEEETGISSNLVSLIAQTDDWLTYDLPDNLIPQIWNGKYRGQQQIWYLMSFQGTDSDINIKTQTPEFSNWQWQPLNILPDMIVPFKKKLYQDLLDYFLPLIEK